MSNLDGLFNSALVFDDYVNSNRTLIGGAVILERDFPDWFHPDAYWGIALVRAATVPEPGTLGLLIFGAAGLAFSLRAKTVSNGRETT